MAAMRSDERTGGQPCAGAALKRRGLIAGAAALAAALIAKQTSQPVAAAGPPVEAANFIADGTATWGFDSGGGTFGGGVSARGTSYGVYAYSTAGGGYGVYAYGETGNSTGVYGSGSGTGGGIFGSGGTSGAPGVYGQGGYSNGAGVVGAAYGAPSPPAGANVGVYGAGGPHTGVYGSSSTGIAVYGLSSGSYGVVGGTTAAGGYGGYFATSSNNSFGLRAEVQGAATGSYGLYATAPAGSTAAYFTGNVYINGSLTVADMTQKHGLLRGPDGTAHLMYTVEAPESWAEDFGTGTLVNGKATVTIDPLFASLVHTDDYHVFAISHDGASKGLAVTGRHADQFEVTEHGGGTSGGTFSYRVVARPKGGKVERLGKYAVPVEPPPAPPLPKVPEPSVAPPSVPLPKKP